MIRAMEVLGLAWGVVRVDAARIERKSVASAAG
jgi:hypothetical protein